VNRVKTGKPLLMWNVSEVIPCQAAAVFGTAEGVETRLMSTNNNSAQERPTDRDVRPDDIVRHSDENRRGGLNSHRNCIMPHQVPGCRGSRDPRREHNPSLGGLSARALNVTSGELREAPAVYVRSEVILSQAAEDFGSAEGAETRGMSSNNNSLQERPTARHMRVDDIVRHSEETRRADVNSQCNSMAAHGNVVAMETMNKTMFILQQLENALFFGDSTLIPEQFDGLKRLITDGSPSSVIDLRGQPLTEEFLNDQLLRIRDNFGQATDAYMTTGVFADLAKQVYDRQRFMVPPAPGTLGATVNAFQGQHGKINLHDSVFIRDGGLPATAGVGASTKRPLDPTITVALSAGAAGASEFVTADDGTYAYRIVAGNRFGRSAPVNVGTVAVVAGDAVTFTVADSGQGTTFYEIYRSAPGAAIGTSLFVTKVARSGASQVITDNNSDLPGTSNMFILMQNQRSFSYAQLLPMTRIPLAAIDTSIRWAQVIDAEPANDNAIRMVA